MNTRIKALLHHYVQKGMEFARKYPGEDVDIGEWIYMDYVELRYAPHRAGGPEGVRPQEIFANMPETVLASAIVHMQEHPVTSYFVESLAAYCLTFIVEQHLQRRGVKVYNPIPEVEL